VLHREVHVCALYSSVAGIMYLEEVGGVLYQCGVDEEILGWGLWANNRDIYYYFTLVATIMMTSPW
jgi:hypothetical protein